MQWNLSQILVKKKTWNLKITKNTPTTKTRVRISKNPPTPKKLSCCHQEWLSALNEHLSMLELVECLSLALVCCLNKKTTFLKCFFLHEYPWTLGAFVLFSLITIDISKYILLYNWKKSYAPKNEAYVWSTK